MMNRVMFRSFLGLTMLAVCSLARPQPSIAQAVVFTENLKVPIDLTVFVPCADEGAGEFVELSGNLHTLTHVTEDSAGGVHLKVHFQPQGISGVGLTTGDSYRATGVTQEHINENSGGLPFTDTFVNNFRIIGQGPGNNFLVHENFHITVNENGVVTAFVDNFSVECK